MRRVISLALAGAVSATSPVSKVVELLKAMQTDLDAEAVADKASQDKMDCWCKDTKKDAKQEIGESTSTIKTKTEEGSEQTGKASEASVKSKDAEAKVASERKALEEMTAVRAQEQAKFTVTEKELVQSISALESAVTVLKKHNSFLQTGKGINEVAATLQATLPRYNSRHMGEITPSQNKALMSFVSQPSFGAYQSQSGEIFGILSSMKDEFTNDLNEERQMEAEAVKTFAKGKEIKQQTIKAQETAYKTQSTKAADAKAASAEAEAAKASAEESLSKANTLLDETTATCNTATADHADRVKARAEEQKAVAQAVTFLNSDEAHALFHSTFKAPSFIQLQNQKVFRVASKLKAAGFNFRNKDMFSLAQAIKAGTFDKVIKAIDDLIKDIDTTIKSDATRRDECTSTLNNKKSKLSALNNQIEKDEAKRAQLESKKATLEQEIDQFEKDIAETQKSQKEFSQEREEQNKEFQVTVQDQNASIKVLNQALTVLKNVYGASLIQQQPEGFKDDGQHAGGNKVLSMISQIINDCQKSKELAVQDENNAQKAYEQSMIGMNDMISSTTDSKDQASGELGRTGEKLASTVATLELNYQEKTSQQTALAARQQECKFLFDNFQVRLDHMNQEKEALAEAKAFLNGMTE